jgi:hypothetical protein
LRQDFHTTSRLVGIDSRSIGHRIEGLDSRQIAVFAEHAGHVPIFGINEPVVAAGLAATTSTSVAHPASAWIANHAVHYLMIYRAALIDRTSLATQLFGVCDRGFPELVKQSSVGDLLGLSGHFINRPCLHLRSMMALDALLDMIIRGASQRVLTTCRMALVNQLLLPNERTKVPHRADQLIPA